MSPVRVKCPTCQREVDWQSAPFRPFCSERCRLIDLGAWLSEQHAIPGEQAGAPEAPAPEKSAPKDHSHENPT
ncbi:MAG TPA: DNA gyrase inhibitor YacG [Steroidobacteraceae bacterium]